MIGRDAKRFWAVSSFLPLELQTPESCYHFIRLSVGDLWDVLNWQVTCRSPQPLAPD
jgi:hypothetical protein